MTNCIHTGCSVYIAPYSTLIRGDLYSIKGHYILYWSPLEGATYWEGIPPVTDYSIYTPSQKLYWSNLDVGVVIVPTANLIAHNYLSWEKLTHADNCLNQPAVFILFPPCADSSAG